ncbi:MAG TPA: RsmE family RNA methyltransferase, partial [Candidatus Eisenbacteria bacterium]
MRSAAEAAPSFLYLPELAGSAPEFSVAGDEARYLARVVRARVGERVSASDGAGLTASLIVERVHPDVVLRVVERRFSPARPGARLLCGAPEGDRGDWLVEKLAELGVGELTPVQTQRARWPGPLRSERWQRLATAALRQSRSA